MPALLLAAHDCTSHVHMIVGSNPLASARCAKSIEVGAKPKVVAPADADVHYVLAQRIDEGNVEWIQKSFDEQLLGSLGREEVNQVVDAVFVTSGGNSATNVLISSVCRRLRIPVNVVDAPNLCTFTLLSTHSDGPLQIGITTSGKGCKLASRIRREIASTLPHNFGDAVERLGTVRRRIWEEDHRAQAIEEADPEIEDDEAVAQKSTFNKFISETDHVVARTRRMRWLSQICEYWPLRRLASITDNDIEQILRAYSSTSPEGPPLNISNLESRIQPKGRIILAGSGPGAPSMLTLATHRAIQTASVVLADKLVPAPVLDLIPRRTPVHIARKFPGNAEAAQTELLTLGHEALQKGHTVLRLKQGDPYLYGRGGEEYAFFRDKGFLPVVLPGITSSLSAPLFAQIPSTHRSVADQVLICTGTGRKGAAPDPPSYVPSQTVVFLMALHRLGSLVESLTGIASNTDSSPSKDDNMISPRPRPWPLETPCAIIERASCPDQRVIRSTLGKVCSAIEHEGSRPPGLLVVGWSCEVLQKPTSKQDWVTEDGFAGFEGLDDFEIGEMGLMTALSTPTR
ncbi:MAG: hypothetical protein HETSPECPRED_007744 [Heterodermia speciosa]|uniref:Precorrin-2 dehydrogenase n=1 Tax=Heterodermia speciosa TaxID=116794 RepID=A0A8H3FTQ2_9LECA|nr:MAG: hypothetical protein HETSPECPRED_007744 [Heterodermia speciosa]